jgi:hypothetical protein
VSSIFLVFFPDTCKAYPTAAIMVASQLKSARMAAHLAKHVKAARSFSSTTAFRREIQDAYILSAARTPTAKVSILP